MTFPTREVSVEPRPALLDDPATAAVSCDPTDRCDARGHVVPRALGREQHAVDHSDDVANITYITFRDDAFTHASAHTVTYDASCNPARDANP